MYSVSDEYSRAIVADTREMPYRVTLAGTIVLDQSKIPNMTLNESASGGSGVSIGTANSASLRLTLRDAEAIDYNDILVEPESGLVLPDGRIEWIPLGKFWVTNSSTNNDYTTVTLTCADGMYHLTGEYESELTYPTTVKAVVGEICAKNGIVFAGLNSLPDITVRRKPEGLTYRDAIGYAAGCCGKNARFNRQGNLEFFWYEDTGITIERKTQYLNGMTKLNDKPLKVGFEVKGQQEIYEITIVSGGNGSVVATPGSNVLEGDTVVLSVNPFSGYELASIIAIAESGASVTLYKNAEDGYTFIQPDSNVTITASFRTNAGGVDPGNYRYEVDTIGSVGQVRVCHGDTDLTAEDVHGEAQAGTIVSVEILPNSGYVFDYFDSNVQLIQVGTNKYNFIMPENDVSITVHFKFSENENDAGLYSWLQKPQDPPTAKPYWAVLYKEDISAPVCQKFELWWFDSWSVSRSTVDGDITKYVVSFDGYYACGGKNKGHGAHEWDTSIWDGNGTSSIGKYVVVDRMVADWDEYYGPSTSLYCLVASNISLFYNGSMLFEKCEHAIGEVQIPYVQDGMDVREKGSLTQFLCPDTFSTPAPGAHWMVLMPRSGLYMTVDEDGNYVTPVSSFPKSLIAFYYDSIAIQNVGAILSSSTEEIYVASFTNGRWTYLRDDVLGWDEEIHDLPEGAVIGLRSPLNGTGSAYVGVGGGSAYNIAGVLASSQTLYDTDGNLFMYNNACRICDCASAATTFSLRRTASVGADYIEAKSITKTYTNPFIYEKAVSDISALVQEVTYTPAKVKHRGNPAFQVGDIVTVPDKDGVNHSVLIMQQTMTFGGGMNSEITCPGQTEQQASFSANGPITTQIKNEVKQSTADIERRVTANNALALASFQKSIGNTEAKIKSVVEWQTEKSKTIAKIEQTASESKAGIELLVAFDEEGKPSTSASLMIDAINSGESTAKISADRLDIEGKTLNIKVDATNITGKLTAEQINADGITASNVDISGRIKAPKGKIAAFDISENALTAATPMYLRSGSEAYIGLSSLSGGTSKAYMMYIEAYRADGYVYIRLRASDNLLVGTSYQVRYRVSTVNLLGTRYWFWDTIDIPISAGASTSAWQKSKNEDSFVDVYGTGTFEANFTHLVGEYIDADQVELNNLDNASQSSPYLYQAGSYSMFSFVQQTSAQIEIYGSLIPTQSGSDLGSSDNHWNDVHATNFTNVSDRNLKNNITDLDAVYSELFDKLRPVKFKFNDGTSGRLHTGFIAQEVRDAIADVGMSSDDFAAYCEWTKEDGSQGYALRYTEMIALCVSEIQKLKARVAELEKTMEGKANGS